MAKTPVFTAIMDTYYRPALLKEAVEALCRQTYENLEIILINNGATEETIDYLHEAAAADLRVKLLHFQENQFSWDDPLKMVDVCGNAALRVATGDYVWHQQDDDLIADDYAEKIVTLFQGNAECTTAAGIPVSIDVDGNLMGGGPRRSNLRPRYMPGHQLALGIARGDRTLFSAPGMIFTIKREVLVEAGGYHRSPELSQLYGIVPFGVTGFDETAHFYWRRHEGQLNKALNARGWFGSGDTFNMLKEWEIERRWQVFGVGEAREIVDTIEKETCDTSASWFVGFIVSGGFTASSRIFRSMWRRKYFWLALARYARQVRWWLAPFRQLLKPWIRRLFRLWPGLAAVSPTLARLSERIDR